MKWFKHDSMALYDPDLRTVGEHVGGEGLWIYWGIVTYISCHSRNFQVRLLGIAEDSGEDPGDSRTHSVESREDSARISQNFERIPAVSVRTLAKILFTTRKKLLRTVEVCVQQELFDPLKWEDLGVLHSSCLTKSLDEYSRKLERSRERVRTLSGQPSENVSLEQDVEQEEEIQNKTEKQTETENKIASGDLLTSAINAEKLSTSDSQATLVPLVSDEDIKQFRHLVWEDIQEWNRRHHENFDWLPPEIEICKLLRGGNLEHKLRLCYQAMNLLGGDATYPRVVRRAVLMMLEASRRKRITNPFGWLWTCLHGNAGGTTPWVQLARASEES